MRHADCTSAVPDSSGIILRLQRARWKVTMKFLRMKPGHGEVVLTEGDPQIHEEEDRLVEAFRQQLDEGMWAAVPTVDPETGRREAQLVQDFREVPQTADRVIFFPRAAGG